MNRRTNRRIALLVPFALLSSFAFAGLPGTASAQQTSTPNKIVDFETVAGSLNPDGSLSRERLLDDLRVYGTGDVTVVDQQPTAGLRNLLGYSGATAAGTTSSHSCGRSPTCGGRSPRPTPERARSVMP